ncbi:MAG: hypothetical protein H7263_02760, partial [Candidatus Sericytochromatia bacterium]|nr:hypothetical protein [Candidatus Sericytochromatia bacterium]
SKLRKIWFQVNELSRSEGEVGNIVKRAITDLYVQTVEFSKALGTPIPVGFKGLSTYVRKNLRYDGVINLDIEDEIVNAIDEQIDDALRGEAFFTDKVKAVLINDVEQSNMMINYLSAPAVLDFRNNIRSAIEEVTDYPDDVDIDALLTQLTYQGLSEISRTVCQDVVEKALFEIPEYLEQAQEKQSEQNEILVSHFHVKIMSNLIIGIKGKKSVWLNYISSQIKERAKEAAKKRAVMVGRIRSEIQEEEDY